MLSAMRCFALVGLLVASCGAQEASRTMITHRLDSTLSARIARCEPLLYAEGASPELDRPAHVRAASGIASVDGELVIVQDDANFIAVRRADGAVDAITLAAGPGGRRRFETVLGNKNDKLDLESAVRVDIGGAPFVLGVGSGSLPARERIAIVDVRARSARLFDASALYARLRANRAFAGSELNVEGAVVIDGALRLFQRGNGAPRDGITAVNATCDVPLEGFVSWLEGGAMPEPTNVRRYDLGTERGVMYGFTDATVIGGRVFVVAGAEDSPDVVQDGDVLGTRIGVIEGDSVRFATLLDAEGRPSLAKVEGIAPTSDPMRLHAVTDLDDPDAPSLLCEIELAGAW
jgi:hypothetical protein